MAAGGNTIEFRVVQTVAASGQVTGERWQVRTKDTLVSVLGVSLGAWSDWQDINVTVVKETLT